MQEVFQPRGRCHQDGPLSGVQSWGREQDSWPTTGRHPRWSERGRHGRLIWREAGPRPGSLVWGAPSALPVMRRPSPFCLFRAPSPHSLHAIPKHLTAGWAGGGGVAVGRLEKGRGRRWRWRLQEAQPPTALLSRPRSSSGLQARSSQVGGRLDDRQGLLSTLWAPSPVPLSLHSPLCPGGPSPRLSLSLVCVQGGLWQFDKSPSAAEARQEEGQPRGRQGFVPSESVGSRAGVTALSLITTVACSYSHCISTGETEARTATPGRFS